MAAKIYLKMVEHDPGKDSVLAAFDPDLPILRGDEDEHLACGQCKAILGRNVSTRRVYELFRAPHRLLMRCECGAHNLVPSQIGSP